MRTDRITIKGKQKPIRPFRQKFIDKKVYGFDLETVNGKPFSMQIFGEECSIFKEIYGWSEKNIIDYLYDNFKGGYLYAHNLSFDLGASFSNMILNNGKKFRFFNYYCIVIYPSPCYAMFSKNKHGVLTFCDTMPFFPMSLKKASEFIGYKKKLKRPDYLGERKPLKNEMDYFKEYAMMDAEICYHLAKRIKALHEEFDIPLRYSVSIASVSAKIFRKFFISKNIPALPKKISDIAIESYHGGRTEAFCFGHSKNATFYDINSSYPYSMSEIIIPVQRKWMKTKILSESGFYNINCNIPKMKISPLPYDKNGLLQFPCGTFKNITVTGIEAIEIKKVSSFFKVNYGYAYEGKKQYLMRDFVDYFFKRKKLSKNKVDYHLNKILMNSLYGKTIQLNSAENEKKGYICGKGFIKNSKSVYPSGLFNPAIASWITAFSRILLYRKMKEFEKYVMYCDTDSIVLTRKCKMASCDKLGEFQKEKTGHDFYVIREKLYVLKDKKILKSGRHAFHGNDNLLLSCIKEKEYHENDEFGKLKYRFFMKEGKPMYKISRMTTLKESKIRKITPFVMEERIYTINLKPSKKRGFENSKIAEKNLNVMSSFFWLKPFFVFE